MDGSFLPNSAVMGSGGIIRDVHGDWVKGFSTDHKSDSYDDYLSFGGHDRMKTDRMRGLDKSRI